MPVDQDTLRTTMRQWATGVTVVTTVFGEERAGMTVSSFTSVSLEPPTVLVCLNHNSNGHRLVSKSGIYAVSMLAEGQDEISNRFAGLDPSVTDRFEGVKVTTAETGAPLLLGAAAHLDCRVVQQHQTSTHTIYIGEVVYAWVDHSLLPLVYHNRKYRLFAPIDPDDHHLDASLTQTIQIVNPKDPPKE
jgi:flavin reductase (DIM6/NTAB) family NADH-FMN oxidoreductase RutF